MKRRLWPAKLIFLLGSGGILNPTWVHAQALSFLPQTARSAVFVEGVGWFERQDDRVRSGSSWDDDFLSQKVSFETAGFVYHPRFLQYELSLAGGLKQEQYTSTYVRSQAWITDQALNYSARAFFFPEHKADFQLFALKEEPLLREQGVSGSTVTRASRGATFRYRARPYFLNARYTHDDLDMTQAQTEVTRLGAEGSYLKDFDHGRQLSLSANASPTQSHSSSGVDGTNGEYSVANTLRSPRLSLSSGIERGLFDQKGTSGRYSSDQLSWSEIFSASLTKNLRAVLDYRYAQSDTTEPSAGSAGIGPRQLSSTDSDVRLDVVHRLYESLDTSYTFQRVSRESSEGSAVTPSHTLVVNYAKKIPHGRMLGGVLFRRTDTDNHGRVDIANEPHPATPVPGSFRLAQIDADAGTVTMFVRSQVPPFETVPLVEGVHYTVTPLGRELQITVLSLPSGFAVPGTYDLFASYSLAAGEFQLKGRAFGANLRVSLLNGGLEPYARYSNLTSETIAGTLPDISPAARTVAVGVVATRGSLRGEVDYQDTQSEMNPYQAWQAQVQYARIFDPTTRFSLSGSFSRDSYSAGTAYDRAYVSTGEYATVSIDKRLWSRLLIAAGGSISQFQGSRDGTSYSFTGTVNWNLAKLTVVGGASVSSSDSQGGSAPVTLPTTRKHTLYYFKIRRRL